jgi:heptosyltransferase-3
VSSKPPEPSPERVLVICLRRLGDVLLSTPLIRSLRRAWPQAQIDALVFAGTEGALENNPDLDGVLTIKPGSRERPFRWRSYSLAIATQYSDRPHLYAFIAAPVRATIVPEARYWAQRWKRWLSRYWREHESARRHTVEQMLQLADALGIPRVPEVVPPRASDPQAWRARLGFGDLPAASYAVVHLAPMFVYKAWTVAGWRSLIVAMCERGLRVVLSGGPATAERALADEVLAGLPAGTPPVLDAVGKLRLSELAGLIGEAQVFVGPDTSVTHLAAASGTPTVTLFGPSNPSVWGPWPQGLGRPAGRALPGESPWQFVAPLQRSGNVTIVQGIKSCVPCLLEGCERHIASRSACLDDLPAARVIAAVDAALAQRPAGSAAPA